MHQIPINSRNSPENIETSIPNTKYLSLSLSVLLFMLHWDLLDPLKLLFTNKLLISTVKFPMNSRLLPLTPYNPIPINQ